MPVPAGYSFPLISCTNTLTKQGTLKIILKILILAVIGFFILSLKEAHARRISMDEGVNRLLVVYDNNTLVENLTPAYGFSCLLMIDQYHILFDTSHYTIQSVRFLYNSNRHHLPQV